MSRFSDYLQKTFHFTSAQAEEVIAGMIKPIGKSIRVNTRKIPLENFKIHAKEQGWTLTETDIPEVFLIDRDDTTIALGNTIEHVAGWFYIQEVAAAHPPFLLKREIMKNEEWRMKNGMILDMCASPGGKTTQLADYFPESLIIANEVNRTRTPQLFDNLDRMGYDNVAVVSCDGRFFQNFPDFFDAVLLDAPCSGEGTAFRDSSIIDHWHEKNIDRIAKLQNQLFETAETIVKPEGFLSYSTCTLNVMENEEVIDSRLKTQEPKLLEVFRKRFWPHIEHTGWFFASIFQKKKTQDATHKYPILAAQGQKNLIVKPVTKGEREIVERFVSKHLKTKLKDGFLYLTKDGVYFNQRNLGPLAEYFYFVHAGMKIGTIKGNSFTPTHHLWWCLQETSQIPDVEFTSLMWSEMLNNKSVTTEKPDGFFVGIYGRWKLGIVSVEKEKIAF
jgi:NOL1/NOP2/sun family putative RNA methylase